MARSNKSLQKAKEVKNDEFYTQLHDIENELFCYLDDGGESSTQFKDKVVLCPCDDPASSNFTLFFAMNFERFGLKKLISTSYSKEGGKGRVFIVDHDITGDGIVNQEDIHSEELEGDGDFRSDEVKALREEADIIVTNPPFSLFREFIDWINPDEKQFLILGHIGAVKYKEVFPNIRDNKVWLGVTAPTDFATPDNAIQKVPTRWYTNLTHYKRNTPMDLVPMQLLIGQGSIDEYKHYDNYDAIDVPKCSLIPRDYTGIMGVPTSFLDVYCPSQFEIIGVSEGELGQAIGISSNYTDADISTRRALNKDFRKGKLCYFDNGKLINVFTRILIRKKQ